MTRFTSDSSFVSSILHSRRHDAGRPASRREVAAALMEMQREDRNHIAPLPEQSSYPTPKNVLDRAR